MFKSISFEDAVTLFKEWGFQVEPGPRPEEVTLVIQETDYTSRTVYPATMLPEIASVALQIRWQNGFLPQVQGETEIGSQQPCRQVHLPAGTASLLRH